jgi:hypothetical protein
LPNPEIAQAGNRDTVAADSFAEPNSAAARGRVSAALDR